MKSHAKLEVLKVYYAHYGLNLSLNEVKELQRVASCMQRLAEQLCNGAIEQDKYDRRRQLLWNSLAVMFTGGPLSPNNIELGGDPRGYCLKISIPSKRAILTPHYYN